MTYRIPLFDLAYGREEEEAVVETLRSRWISMGPEAERFEDRFRQHIGVDHAVAVSNGTAALHLALLLADVGPGDEVIVPSMTFVATVNAVRYCGAKPVFCDLTSLSDLTLDPKAAAGLLTPRTKAIVVMHYGGFPCDMARIMDLSRQNGLPVIEDAAHAPGSFYGERSLGTIGTIGCFSFFANKNIATGEGGMLVTGDPALAKRARLLRSHGMTTLSYQRATGHSTSYDVIEMGYNYRLDDIRAALGVVQLDKLAADCEIRARVRGRYVDCLSDQPDFILPFPETVDQVSNYIMPVVLKGGGSEKRDFVRARLQEQGIQTSVHYPAVHRFSTYAAEAPVMPNTEHVADHEITLPMHGSLTFGEVDEVCAGFRQALLEWGEREGGGSGR